MSSKTLEGMARASMDADGWKFDSEPGWIQHAQMERQRKGLEWLASNVSDEMVREFENSAVAARGLTGSDAVRAAISAALRAAGDGR